MSMPLTTKSFVKDVGDLWLENIVVLLDTVLPVTDFGNWKDHKTVNYST